MTLVKTNVLSKLTPSQNKSTNNKLNFGLTAFVKLNMNQTPKMPISQVLKMTARGLTAIGELTLVMWTILVLTKRLLSDGYPTPIPFYLTQIVKKPTGQMLSIASFLT